MALEWRPIPGYEHRYEISESGEIRNSLREKPKGSVLGRSGYLHCSLYNGKGAINWFVHRLVAMAFIGPPPSDRHVVAHNDGNKLNNHYKNLRWATYSENAMDKYAHGTMPAGERHYRRAKLTDLRRGAECP